MNHVIQDTLHTPAAADPALAAAVKAFLTPVGAQDRRSGLAAFTHAQRHRLATPVGDIAWAEWGDGLPVLLVHGWQGSAGDMLAIGERLRQAGRRVVAMDLPAHGDSAGVQTDLPRCALAVKALLEALGAPVDVVAHSVGAAATVEAARLGAVLARVALVGAPARYRDYVDAFAQAARQPTEAIRAALAARGIDVDVDSLDVPRIAPGLQARALLVHAVDDRVVPITDARAIAAAWPGAQLLELTESGHRRILQQEATLAAIGQFLA